MAKVKTSGNAETMNLNNILYQNIIASPYFKSLYEKKTYHEVLDEIVRNVTTLEPFLKGTHASTAFCLLYKLWTLRLTIKQMTGILNHKDSPHVRALGLLYLRYVGDPSELWDWYVDYLDDETEVRAEGGVKAKVITIGKMCHMLLMEPKWFGTILPRIPVPIARDIEKKLKEYHASYQEEFQTERANDDRNRRDDGYRRETGRRRSRTPEERYRRTDRSRSPRSSHKDHRDRHYGRERSPDRRRSYDDRASQRDRDYGRDGERDRDYRRVYDRR
ncbi:putative RNA binding protein [Zopfochytrium polystomum]|nr:putative RNA binding protein [Zopfochytrium polystomum]